MQNSLKTRAFAVFAVIAFINAFVDLGHKILIQNTIFKSYDGGDLVVLSAVVNALILLPFILMMSPSSFLADKYPKHLVMKYSALTAVVVTTLITLFYYLGWFWAAFAMTFVLALQSAIYSPAKYGYIRELVGVKQLAPGNGAIQALTTSAILLGTLAFSLGFEYLLKGASISSKGDILALFAPLGFVLIALSVLEYRLACKLENKSVTDDESVFNIEQYFKFQDGTSILKGLHKNQVILLSVVGLAIFWSVAQVVLASFPAFAKEASGITNTAVIQGVMAFAGIGIVIGSLVAGRISKNYIETGLIPLGAVGIALTVGLTTLWHSPVSQAINFALLGFFGGLYLVPLNSLIQYHAKQGEMGRVLAGNNFVQNVFMLIFLMATMGAAMMGSSATMILASLFVVAVAGAIYTLYKLPQSLMRILVGRVISWRYRLTVLGMDNLPAKGGVLLLGNHISWIDWAILSMASPRPIRFVMASSIYDRWYIKMIVSLFNAIPVSSAASKTALSMVRDSLNAGEVVCLFPEGGISRNGQLGEFKRGFEMAAEGADAVIVPFYLRGLWGSSLSRSSDKLKSLRGTGTVNVIAAFGSPMPIGTMVHELKQVVAELSISAWQAYAQQLPTLPAAIVRSLKRVGSEMAAADIGGVTLSGDKLLTAATCFSRRISEEVYRERGGFNCPLRGKACIGIMLPATTASLIANTAALMTGSTVVNINFTASHESIEQAILQANIKVLVTSRNFINKLKAKGFSEQILKSHVKVMYMEDIKDGMSKAELLGTMLAVKLLPGWLLERLLVRSASPDATAAILFSSGSEGAPKGVMLSHRNLMANIQQVSDMLNIQHNDVVMATLPPFHAFGLTVTSLMPLVEGVPVVCHPDPTDVRNIARGIATYRATMLCGTATFLRLYVRNSKVEPLMLESLRVVVAGAEKLPTDVRDGFKLKFNKDIFEGYGATETTPVASVNMPDSLDLTSWKAQIGNKRGTVGLPLPGTSFRVVDPDTMERVPQGEDGLILIGGVQVMQGYLNAPEKTDSVIVERGGARWYRTGDKGHIDKDGFLVIVDRYSRFAKIGGEMVGLGAIEQFIAGELDGHDIDILATAIPDPKKGEKIVLLYTCADADGDRVMAASKKLPPLSQPTNHLRVNEIPKLGTGKTDFAKAKQIAEAAELARSWGNMWID